MANRFPLIVNSNTNQIQELAAGDNLDLTSSGISSVSNIYSSGIVTATSFVGNLTGTATGLSGNPSITVTGINASGITTVSAGSAAAPSISPSGDSNTGIFFPSADTLAASTGGSGRLTIDSNGNINIDSGTVYVDAVNNRLGIGTSIPGALVDVSGSGNIVRLGDGTNTFDVRFKGPNNWAVQLDTPADNFTVQRNGVGFVTINGAGRVGIGTTSPGAKLQINQNTDSAAAFLTVSASANTALTADFATLGLQNTNTTNNNYNTVGFINDQGGYSAGIHGIYTNHTAGAQSGEIAFGTRNAGTYSERARIDSSGRFLVGTSSARSNLFNTSITSNIFQVEGAANSTGISVVTNGNTGETAYLAFCRSKGTTIGSNTLVSNGDVLGTLTFQGSDGTEFVDGARIEAYVDGIPGANDMPGRLVFSTTADGAATPTERMRITSSGNVGFNASTFVSNGQLATKIGTNYYNFGANNSNAFIVYNSSGIGVYLVDGNTNWSANSDERLKTNLTPIQDGLSKVSSLRAVTGRYLNDDESVSRSFLIAQDVQAVLPEAVDVQADGQGTLGLRYTEVIPLLVAALKELKERIETLEAKVADFEKEQQSIIEQQQVQINALLARLDAAGI